AASGQLGGYLLPELRAAGSPVTAWSGSRRGELFGVPPHPVDLSDTDAVVAAFRQARPDAVIHAGARARIADCHRDPDHAYRVNTAGSGTLAELSATAGARLLLVSTDLVFDGERAPYREEDPTAPTSVYGLTTSAAETAVLAA